MKAKSRIRKLEMYGTDILSLTKRILFYFLSNNQIIFEPLINKLFSNQINKKDLLKNL